MILLHVPEVNCILDTEAIIGKHIKTLVFNVLKIHFLRSCLLYWDNRISVKNQFYKIKFEKKKRKKVWFLVIFGPFWSSEKDQIPLQEWSQLFAQKNDKKRQKWTKINIKNTTFFLWLILLLRQTIFDFWFLFFHFFWKKSKKTWKKFKKSDFFDLRVVGFH